MSRNDVPHVKLRQGGPLDVDRVLETIATAREVACRNRNRTWGRRIVCVTDDHGVARGYLRSDASRRHLDRTVEMSYGSTWGDCGDYVIWVSPRHPSSNEEINTWNHELAHALTVGAHGHVWRRMHLMLLPLTYATFGVDVGDITRFAHETSTQVVARYRRVPYAYSLQVTPQVVHRVMTRAAANEVVKHSNAVERRWDKYRKR